MDLARVSSESHRRTSLKDLPQKKDSRLSLGLGLDVEVLATALGPPAYLGLSFRGELEKGDLALLGRTLIRAQLPERINRAIAPFTASKVI